MVWRQAERDASHAAAALAAGHYDWTVYAAQQAAEKALKAVLLGAGRAAPPLHALDRLFDLLVAHGIADAAEHDALRDALSALVQGWAVSRYPLAGIEVAPADLITRGQAEAALAQAGQVLAFARAKGAGA
jgi:HEPN domain-containing protein